MTNRFGDIINDIDRTYNEEGARRDAANAAALESAKFGNAWRDAYLGEDATPEEYATRVTANLIALGQHIKDNFWDYRLGTLLRSSETGRSTVLASIILLYACAGRKKDVESCILKGYKYIGSIMDEHRGLIGLLRNWHVSHGLPHTPPLSQRDVMRILKLTPKQFRYGAEKGKWMTPESHPEHRYVRLRCWRHTDEAVQRMLLEAIRTKFPEKVCPKEML